MANKKDKWQEIANRGLQDRFDPQTRAKFDEAVRRGLISMPSSQPQEATKQINPDVPMGGDGPAFPERPQQEPRTIGENIIGAGEAALTMGTAATGGALGYLANAPGAIYGELTGELTPEQAMEKVQDGASDYTYSPRTEAGQEIAGAIGEAASVLPPVGLTGGVTPKLGIPNIKLPKTRNKALTAINESGGEQVKKSFTKKLGEDHFEPRIFGMVKEARKQGFDDSITTLIANSSPITKRRMLQQVGVVERGKGDARIKALERTADIAGDSLVKKVNYVKQENKKAGQQLGRVAETLKNKKVNMLEPVNKFTKTLEEKLGVSFDDDMTPNFKGSDLETFPESRKLVNDLTLKIKQNQNPSALDAHKFKKLIDKSVRYGKSDGKLDGDLERAAKQLRSGINDRLSAEFPKYKEANKRFSDTITALDDLQDVAGGKLDFYGPNANKAAGVLLRSQTNNTKGRANLLTSIENLENTAQKYGGSFDDDILNLSIFSDELDAVFGSGARTSLRGEVGKAGVDTAIDLSQMSVPGALAVGAKAGAKKLRGINEKNQLKAIKKLLSAK